MEDRIYNRDDPPIDAEQGYTVSLTVTKIYYF
jgi:hypothetical protein